MTEPIDELEDDDPPAPPARIGLPTHRAYCWKCRGPRPMRPSRSVPGASECLTCGFSGYPPPLTLR